MRTGDSSRATAEGERERRLTEHGLGEGFEPHPAEQVIRLGPATHGDQSSPGHGISLSQHSALWDAYHI